MVQMPRAGTSLKNTEDPAKDPFIISTNAKTLWWEDAAGAPSLGELTSLSDSFIASVSTRSTTGLIIKPLRIILASSLISCISFSWKFISCSSPRANPQTASNKRRTIHPPDESPSRVISLPLYRGSRDNLSKNRTASFVKQCAELNGALEYSGTMIGILTVFMMCCRNVHCSGADWAFDQRRTWRKIFKTAYAMNKSSAMPVHHNFRPNCYIYFLGRMTVIDIP